MVQCTKRPQRARFKIARGRTVAVVLTDCRCTVRLCATPKHKRKRRMPNDWNEATHSVAGTNVRVLEAGSGPPVVILHHDIGTLDRLPFYDALAAEHRVILPIHPGWGLNIERPEWMRSVRDIAAMYRMHLAAQGIQKAHLVGLGFGGWIAAEMASTTPAPSSMTRPSSRKSMASRPATCWRASISAARCASEPPGSLTCSAKPCRTCCNR